MKANARLNEILTRLLRSVLKIEEEAMRRASSGELSASETHVLAEIGVGKARTMTQVAVGLKISVGALTASMNKLVKKGYVNRFRVAEDRRIVKVELTEKGAATVREHDLFHEAMADSACGGMGGEQRELLIQLMENIDEYYKIQAIQPLREGADLALKPIRIGNIDIPAPIFQGDMGAAFSSPGMAAAVAACGGVGLITAAHIGFAEADYAENPAAANRRALKRDVRRALELLETGGGTGAVGVNIKCTSGDYEALVRTAVEAGARLILSGGGVPAALPGIVRGADVKLLPIVSSVRALAVLRRRWAKKHNRAPDAVIFEGPCKGGPLGFKEEQLEAAESRFYQTILEIRRELEDLPSCPLIVANGVMRREDVKKALACGADGVQLEEQFAAAAECAAPPAVRRVYTEAGGRETVVVKSHAGMPVRILRNALAERILAGGAAPGRCIGGLDNCPGADIPCCAAEGLVAAARGDAEGGLLFCCDAFCADGRRPAGAEAPGTVAGLFKLLNGKDQGYERG
jgi:NAD(P)H-dependent flavin oxidoreductase YrpB (nitropropane dioxygenase family)/DNA-binding MarR family transcriptional regulator